MEAMNTPRAGLNMDRAQRVVVETAAMDWEASPASGVWRKKLERAGEESGQVTSVVRYAPGSRFAAHVHPLGEEIFVLSGVFADDAGDAGYGDGVEHRSTMTEAIDVARTASRSGAREVTVISLESREEMPAHDFEVEEAQHEGVDQEGEEGAGEDSQGTDRPGEQRSPQGCASGAVVVRGLLLLPGRGLALLRRGGALLGIGLQGSLP